MLLNSSGRSKQYTESVATSTTCITENLLSVQKDVAKAKQSPSFAVKIAISIGTSSGEKSTREVSIEKVVVDSWKKREIGGTHCQFQRIQQFYKDPVDGFDYQRQLFRRCTEFMRLQSRIEVLYGSDEMLEKFSFGKVPIPTYHDEQHQNQLLKELTSFVN